VPPHHELKVLMALSRLQMALSLSQLQMALAQRLLQVLAQWCLQTSLWKATDLKETCSGPMDLSGLLLRNWMVLGCSPAATYLPCRDASRWPSGLLWPT